MTDFLIIMVMICMFGLRFQLGKIIISKKIIDEVIEKL